MAFMDRFRFGGQNDLLQMPNQNKQFGMFQNPFPQQNQQQQGFGMFRNPMQQFINDPNVGSQPIGAPQQGGGMGPNNGNQGHLPWNDQMQSEYDNLTRPGGPWEGKEEFLKNYLSLDKSGFRGGGLRQTPQIINNPWNTPFKQATNPAPVDWGKVNLNSGANQGDPNWVDPQTGAMPYKPLPPGMVRQGG